MCEVQINIVLFYESAHTKVKSSRVLSVLPLNVVTKHDQAKNGGCEQLSNIFLKMHWNILKVVQFIAVANINCIHINKGEI